MNINKFIFLFFTFLLMLAISASLSTRAVGGEWQPMTRTESFVIKDDRGIRKGKLESDRVRGGYKIKDNYGITIGRVDSVKGSLTNSRYNFKIERKR
jgi:hypothetical protein